MLRFPESDLGLLWNPVTFHFYVRQVNEIRIRVSQGLFIHFPILPTPEALHRSNRVGEEWFLPKHLVPEWYNIRLLPFLDEGGNFTTDGHVEIFVHCLQNTTSVVLNVAEITIVRNSVTVR